MTSTIVCAAAPRPLDVDIFLPPMLRNSYGTLSGGSRSNTSRAIASERSREPPAVERSLPPGSIVTPKSDHWAAHSRFQGSFAAPPNGLIQPDEPQPRAHVDEVRPALEEDPLAVPGGDDGGADLAAGRADDAERVPVLGMLDVRDAAIDVADERRPDRAPVRMYGIHRAGRVDVAHPVVAVRVDAESGERLDEHAGEMAGVALVAVAGGIGHVGERAAHLAIDRVGRQERLGVHRVEIVDAVQERRLVAVGTQRADDDVEDDGAAQAADVDGAGRRLRVVDDLRAADPGREFVSPVHRGSPRP